jgi:tetratricopeptide (TPR) repeat protein
MRLRLRALAPAIVAALAAAAALALDEPPTAAPAPAATTPPAEAKKAKAPVGNPERADAALELQRLRLEGRANYEAGVTLKSALPLFEKALQMKPDSAVELFNLGTLKRKLNVVDEARTLLQKAGAADPTLLQPLYTLAMLEKSVGNEAAALQLLEKARTLAPAEPSVHYQLAMLYRAAGRDDAMLQSLTTLLGVDPFHAGGLYQLYLYEKRVHNEERAAEIFSEFSRLKRAATASRKEVNYDDGPLVMPLADSAYDVSNAGERRGSGPSLRARSLETPQGGVGALALRDLDGDEREELVALGADGRVHVFADGAAPKPLDGPPSASRDGLTLDNFAARGAPGLLVSGAQGLAVGKLEAGKLAWASLSGGPDRPLLLFDADHDGDQDVLAERERAMWLNRGNGDFFSEPTFFTQDVRRALSDATGVAAANLSNGDGVDLLLWSTTGTRALARDSRGGRYDLVTGGLPALPGARAVELADLDNDGRIDVVTLTDAQLWLEFNQGDFKFQAAAPLAGGGTQAAVADFDNDGLKDLVVFKPGTAPVLWSNLGRRRFEPQPLGKTAVSALRGAPIVGDVDADGRLDFATVDAQGAVTLWHNDTPGAGRFLRLRLAGVRSVPSGKFTQVEVRIGARYQKVEADGGIVHFGLGGDEYAEVLRIIWPNGFVENKFKVDAGSVFAFKESERVSGSCPSLFVWDGGRFRHLTDLFISGPMGVPVGKGRYFPVDHDEYVKIPGDRLRARDGRYSIRITEELREVDYLDSLRLIALDHPASVEVYPDERLGPFPFPEFKLHALERISAPMAARDDAGRDVLDLVSRVDGRYPKNVARTQYAGLAEPHWIEIELPEQARASEHLRVLLTGWFYYFESTSLMAISQRPDLRVDWPEIQARVDGEWRSLAPAGVPPGKHKTIVVDLSGRVPPGTRTLRVRTTLAMYWDAIRLDTSAPAAPASGVRARDLPLRSAELRFRGLSRLLHEVDPSVPEHFDYNTVTYASLWNPLRGRYTRYGDVAPLLRGRDSRLAVFGTGDELALEFDATTLSPPAPGMVRDFLLYLDGYVKDGDPYTAYAGEVSPMPYAGMKQFPFAPEDWAQAPFESPDYREYLSTYQTREPLRFSGPDLAGPVRSAVTEVEK